MIVLLCDLTLYHMHMFFFKKREINLIIFLSVSALKTAFSLERNY